MASPLRLSVHLPDEAVGPEVADRCWLAVRDEFEASEEALSRFRESSDLTAANRVAGDGGWLTASPRLRRALVAADRARRLSGGRFDPRVLVALDALGYRGAEIGDEARARSVDPDRAVVEVDRSGLLRVGVPVDLGGIGKGLALRWAAKRAVQELDARTRRERAAPPPIAGLLIDAGGDIVARGRGPLDGAWNVGIEDPAGGPAPLAVVALGDGAIATSSVLRTRWEVDGRSVHHLLDPASGGPSRSGLLAVTVAASDPAWAEVWAKTLFIAGFDRIADLARGRGLAAWWVAEDGGLRMTAGARQQTIWVAAEA
jgi:thiamine biosynthesis lipoprotein